MIDAPPQDLALIAQIIRDTFADATIKVFGSRVKGNAHKYSDLDVAIVTDKNIELAVLADIKEQLSNTTIPYRVDVVDWQSLSGHFKAIIDEQYEYL